MMSSSSSTTTTTTTSMGGHSQNHNQNHNHNGGKAMVPPPPHLDGESTKMLNLTVLQRMDEFVEEILITAAHVTLYQFNIDLNQWSRKDVEGSLFLVKRNTQPRFQFIVMNRRNTDNLVEDLLGDFEYEVQVPYLLYRNAAQEVNGIWFYNSHECEAVANLFNRILSAFTKLPPKTKLSSAKSEFEELEAVPTMSVMEGPLEPQTSAVSTPPDVADDSFINFFSTALSTGNASNPANVVGQQHSLTAPGPAPSHVQTAVSMVPPVLQASVPLPISTTPHIPALHTPDPITNVTTNQASSLLKPSFFTPSTAATLMMPPLVSSSVPTAPPLQTAVTLQRPYGTPLLQPFPPPTPPPSLTPAQSNSPVITREKVQEALVRLAQNNKFVDMVYQEILNAHHS